MGAYSKQTKALRLPIPEHLRESFQRFNALCVVEQRPAIEVLAECIKPFLQSHSQKLEGRWMKWDDFKEAMKENGYTVNRTTFWKYRKQGYFEDAVKTDGASTVFNLDSILAFFRGQSQNN